MTNPKVFSAVNRAVVVTMFDAVWGAVRGALDEAVHMTLYNAVWRAVHQAVYQAVEDPEQSSLQDFLREVHRAAE